MLNKKLALLILFLILSDFLFLTLIKAQETPPGLPPQLGQSPEETLEQLKNKTETKWDYLGEEWRNILLKNKIVSALDAFFTKISIVFRVLFGTDYSLSLTLLVVVVLWFYFLFKFAELFRDFTAFSSGTSWIMALGLAIVMAQLQILRKITEGLGWLVFARKAWWWNLITILILIIVFILIYKLSSAWAKKAKESREKLEKEKTEQAGKVIQATAKGITEGLE